MKVSETRTATKTTKPTGILLAVVGLTAAILTFIIWSFNTMEGLANIVRIMTQLCQGLLSQCLGYLALGRITLLWTGGLLLLAGLIFASGRAIFTLIRSRQALNRLPLKNKKAELVLIEDSNITTAFTHGIIHPRIYISKGLMDGLDGTELRAVIHHELSHKKNKDPLRFFLLSILRDVLFFIPLVTYASRLIRDKQEKRADDMAVCNMREPLSIAGALVKLLGARTACTAETASIQGRRGFMEERIRRLLGEKTDGDSKKGPGLGAVLVSVLFPLFMIVSLAIPLKQGMPLKMSTCGTSRCAGGKEKPVTTNCRIHCDKVTRNPMPTPLTILP